MDEQEKGEIDYPCFVDINSIELEGDTEYRYWLKIPFKAKDLNNFKTLCVILKNPSKADKSICDQTIRRVCNVAKYNKYSEVVILNLFPYKSTDAKNLKCFCENKNDKYKDIINLNLDRLKEKCKNMDVVLAWGTNTISKSKAIQEKYDYVIEDIIKKVKKIANNMYYVRNDKDEKCNNQQLNTLYPLHGLRWHNDSTLTPILKITIQYTCKEKSVNRDLL